ncbi:FAD-dependent oxidoreductase [Baaleninema simplex]|uniref:FAD-dependent oxidoreductase n=1 Tax=Baaleninema simplex TaxID=2862350 RepID=UPI00034A304C|nr:FAD-dependent oxidoreductase [Baaleninema simplex]
MSPLDYYNVDVLVVGGGTGGTAAAIQAARRGANTLLVSDRSWIGGMLTAAGVCAPDGNELHAFQTGLWGAFLRELRQRQPGGLDNAWVSFFTFDPRIGERIFQDWVKKLPNLHWISGRVPQEVRREGDRVFGVRFEDFSVEAKIVLDGTELGDLLELGEIPYRWGWETRAEFDEPSAPETLDEQFQRYPVQAITWVAILQDFGKGNTAPEIHAPPLDTPDRFVGAWTDYGVKKFLRYGRLPGKRFMLNWPHRGNDYGEGLNRLVESTEARAACLQEAKWRSQSFARFLQRQLGRRYGCAGGIFPHEESGLALHPYFRESRRLVGAVTVREQDVLPMPGGTVAPLPLWDDAVESVAVGNYANDHHYTDRTFPVVSKTLRWGGRVTGTPFSLPYRCLIPAEIDGLLACEKNISVSHIANGCTRLQPVVMGIGQAAGMAAALCIERDCQPRELPVRALQEALLDDAAAAASVVPLFDSLPDRPDWRHWQEYYLDRPDTYPLNGRSPNTPASAPIPKDGHAFSGEFRCHGTQDYELITPDGSWRVVTLHPTIDRALQTYPDRRPISGWGRFNVAGNWLLVESIADR